MMTRMLWTGVASVLVCCAGLSPAWADDPQTSPGKGAGAKDREAAEVAQALRESWPDHPEWVDMLADILEEEPMGPDFGWFRTAVTQTRFDWDSTRNAYDRDGDGRVDAA